MIHCRIRQSLQSSSFSNSESLNNGLRMYSLTDKLLCFSQEFCRKDTDGSSSITDFIVLYFTDVNENFGRCVV